MTPQERELVNGLFDRLARIESAPRDPEAEKTIMEGLRRAPNAVYALVQTALVQDEALKRANARIQELEGEPGGTPQAPSAGFLDSMRDALMGRRDSPRSGSVPSVRPGQAAPGGAAPLGAPAQPPFAAGGGGSFLGTAASAAAGVVGGALLLDGIRSMMGSHRGFGVADQAFGDQHERGSPWDAGNSELAHQGGIDDIGNTAHHDRDEHTGADASDHAGSHDTDNSDLADNQPDQDVADADYDDNQSDQDVADANYDTDGSDFGGDFGGSSDV